MAVALCKEGGNYLMQWQACLTLISCHRWRWPHFFARRVHLILSVTFVIASPKFKLQTTTTTSCMSLIDGHNLPFLDPVEPVSYVKQQRTVASMTLLSCRVALSVSILLTVRSFSPSSQSMAVFGTRRGEGHDRPRRGFAKAIVDMSTSSYLDSLSSSAATLSPPPPSASTYAGDIETTTASSEAATLPSHIKDTWGIVPDISSFPGAHFPLGHVDAPLPANSLPPPILELPNFLSAEECATIRQWATQAIADGADECDEYLNARVNNEVETLGESEEGKALIEECQLDSSTLSASDRGGFRIRLDPSFVTGMLKDRILRVLNMPERNFVFEEGAWIRPSPRSIIVRDQTVVYYGPSNGVPPHVDGKDGTLLVYLSDGTLRTILWILLWTFDGFPALICSPLV